MSGRLKEVFMGKFCLLVKGMEVKKLFEGIEVTVGMEQCDSIFNTECGYYYINSFTDSPPFVSEMAVVFRCLQGYLAGRRDQSIQESGDKKNELVER